MSLQALLIELQSMVNNKVTIRHASSDAFIDFVLSFATAEDFCTDLTQSLPEDRNPLIEHIYEIWLQYNANDQKTIHDFLCELQIYPETLDNKNESLYQALIQHLSPETAQNASDCLAPLHLIATETAKAFENDILNADFWYMQDTDRIDLFIDIKNTLMASSQKEILIINNNVAFSDIITTWIALINDTIFKSGQMHNRTACDIAEIQKALKILMLHEQKAMYASLEASKSEVQPVHAPQVKNIKTVKFSDKPCKDVDERQHARAVRYCEKNAHWLKKFVDPASEAFITQIAGFNAYHGDSPAQAQYYEKTFTARFRDYVQRKKKSLDSYTLSTREKVRFKN